MKILKILTKTPQRGFPAEKHFGEVECGVLSSGNRESGKLKIAKFSIFAPARFCVIRMAGLLATEGMRCYKPVKHPCRFSLMLERVIVLTRSGL